MKKIRVELKVEFPSETKLLKDKKIQETLRKVEMLKIEAGELEKVLKKRVEEIE